MRKQCIVVYAHVSSIHLCTVWAAYINTKKFVCLLVEERKKESERGCEIDRGR